MVAITDRNFRRKVVLFFFFLGLPALLGVVVYLGLQRTRSTDLDPKSLVVVAYSSFLNSWGPGPQLKEQFEKKYGIKIQWIDGGDSALIVERLRFQSMAEHVDVILGLDQLTVPDARALQAWRTVDIENVTWHEDLPFEALHRDFIPFDWAPLTFIYRRGEMDPPKNLDDLLDPRFRNKIAVQDPRTSTPGLQFLYWILSVKGVEEGFAFLKKLAPNIHSVSSSWSTSYGFFKRQEAATAFSYVTSPLYHLLEERDNRFNGAEFEEGVPYQVEYAAIPERCVNCAAAEKFVRFLVSEEAQRLIMKKNYMLPTVQGISTSPFDLKPNRLVSIRSDALILRKKRDILSQWKKLGL